MCMSLTGLHWSWTRVRGEGVCRAVDKVWRLDRSRIFLAKLTKRGLIRKGIVASHCLHIASVEFA